VRLSDLPEGARVFIDANIFIYHFSAASRFNSSCTNFLERVEFGAVHGVTSAAIVLETIHRIMVEEAFLALPDIQPKNLVKYLKDHPDTVKGLEVNRGIPARIAQFNVEVIPTTMALIDQSQTIKTEYGFLSNDALILQIMRDRGLLHLASNDSDFERATNITLYKPDI
jgi:predicted nucleic acid-binding protein